MSIKWLIGPEYKMAGKKGMKWSKLNNHSSLVRIETQKIANRLHEHVLGNVDMPASAVTAALGLLKKRLPDLAATTITGDKDNPLQLTVSAIQQTIVKADRKLIEHDDASHALPNPVLPDKDTSNIK